MDFRQLRYFAKVAEARSLTRAAESLNIAQPALSLQMQKLEDEIGQQLLIRHSRGIELTETGERLLGHARQIIQQFEIAQRDVREMKGELSGRLRLGMPRGVAEVFALDLITAAAEKLPKVAISIVELLGEDINELLVAGRLDLGFSYNVDDAKRLDCEPLMTERLCFVERAGESAGGREIDFAEAAQQPLILPAPPRSLRTQIEEAAQYRGTMLNVVHDVESLPLLRSMVEAGKGCTILPFSLAEDAIRVGNLVARPLVQPEITRRLHIVYPSRPAPSKPHLAIRTMMFDIVRRYAATRAFGGLIELEIPE